MKKILLISLGILIVGFLLIYLYKPNQESISKNIINYTIIDAKDMRIYKSSFYYDTSSRTLRIYLKLTHCGTIHINNSDNTFYVSITSNIATHSCKKLILINNVHNQPRVFLSINNQSYRISQVNGFCGVSEFDDCSSDKDCAVQGCSGEVCGTKREGLMTACVWKYCYESGLFGMSCKCVNHKCQWIKTNNTITSWAYQLQDTDPDQIVNSSFQLIVMDYSRTGEDKDRYSKKDINKIIDSGKIPIAYLSIGEAENYRFYWNQSIQRLIVRQNPEWKGNYLVRYWDPEWRKILHEYIDKIINQGFRGVYLDKIDSYEEFSNDSARKMIDLIIDIANYSRSKVKDFYIIPQNGESILEYDNGSLISIVNGWAAEDLFFNGTNRWNESMSIEIAKERIAYLDKLFRKRKLVLSVDYVDDGTNTNENMERINEYIGMARNKGYIPYAARSDRQLDELNIIPGIQ